MHPHKLQSGQISEQKDKKKLMGQSDSYKPPEKQLSPIGRIMITLVMVSSHLITQFLMRTVQISVQKFCEIKSGLNQSTSLLARKECPKQS